MLQQRSYLLTIISIAIIIGGIVFVALGTVIFSGAANLSDSVIQDALSNKTSGMKSKIMAKTAVNALAPLIKTFTEVTKMFFTSIASFLCLVGAGICVLGFALFKIKYFAWVITIVLMFLAIVIDVVGLGFVGGGSFTHDSNNKGIIPTDLAYILIAVLIIHLIANSGIIYYLTRKSTILYFRTTKT